MPARLTPLSLARTARVAVMATAMILGSVSVAPGQSMRAGGSIGVSMTILPPAPSESVQLVGFHVDRNGLATLQTSAPAGRPASRIVMATVERDSSAGIDTRQFAALSTSASGSPTQRYVVDLGRVAAGQSREPVQLRLRYLTVAGT
jgi:hypothetical protein